jgi:hypothetical protein
MDYNYGFMNAPLVYSPYTYTFNGDHIAPGPQEFIATQSLVIINTQSGESLITQG